MADKKKDTEKEYWSAITCPHCNHQIGWNVQEGETWLDKISGAVKCCVCKKTFPVKCAPEHARGRIAAEWERTGSLAKDTGGPTLQNLGDYLREDEERDDEDCEDDEERDDDEDCDD